MILKISLICMIASSFIIRATIGEEKDLMNTFEIFLEQRYEEMQNTCIWIKDSIKEIFEEKAIPISQLPFYTDRAENKIFDVNSFKNVKSYKNSKIQFGRMNQIQAEKYGFYDMNDVKIILREFFVNSSEIWLYRGLDSLNKDIVQKYEDIKVVEPKDIEPNPTNMGKSRLWWWYFIESDKNSGETNRRNRELLNLYCEDIEYHELASAFDKMMWYLHHIYKNQYAQRESLIHQHLKEEQAKDFDFDKWKEEVEVFVTEVERLLTGEKHEQIKKSSFAQKAKKYVADTIKWKKEKHGVYIGVHELKKDVLKSLLKKRQNTKLLDYDTAVELMTLFASDWKIFFYLHVSGTIESTKLPPKFYLYSEPEKEEDSDDYSELESKTSHSNNDEISQEYLSTEVGFRTVSPDFPQEVISLEGENPFRNIVEAVFKAIKLGMKTMKKTIIKGLKDICEKVMKLEENNCNFIERVIADIHTNVVIKQGKIAGDKYCRRNEGVCEEIDHNSYSLYIRKITEIQATSMATLEYLMLECKRKKKMKGLKKEDKAEIKRYAEDLFENDKTLPIFITKEYQKILINFIDGSKDFNVLKLIDMKVKAEKKNEEIVEWKPYKLDVHDMDETLQRECYSCFIKNKNKGN